MPATLPSPAPRPADFHVAVDVVLFSLRNDLLHIGVVQRRGDTAYLDQNHLARRHDLQSVRRVVAQRRDPNLHWALPGGHVGHTLLGDEYGTGDTPDASLEAAALRVLRREAGLALQVEDLHQIGAFGDANRDPRSGRTVSVAYLAIVGDDRDVSRHVDDAIGHVSRVQFRPVVDVLARPNRLEFDHEDIVMSAIGVLRNLAITTPLATRFCRDEFTLGELRRVFEVIFHQSLDSAEAAEAPGHADKIRAYLSSLERLGDATAPELERTVSELASLVPMTRLDRSDAASEGLASRGTRRGTDRARQAELLARLARHSSGLRTPRPPRLLKPLDPTNFARKMHKLDILEPVRGETRPTFERYGKPAALFRLRPGRAATPFLLRLESLGKTESSG
jgi:ADP-ribose pyrophosphatase YjhB (NUDIX family)